MFLEITEEKFVDPAQKLVSSNCLIHTEKEITDQTLHKKFFPAKQMNYYKSTPFGFSADMSYNGVLK